MIKISKEEADRMVLGVLSQLSKIEDKTFAEQSLKIMDNGYDNSILTAILLNKAKPSIFSDEEQTLQASIISIISCFFETAQQFNLNLKEDGFSELLIKTFENEDYDDKSKNYNPSMKIVFAVSQFANAFLEYERLERDYPAVMKLM